MTMPSTTTGLTTSMMDSGAATVNDTMEDTASETIATPESNAVLTNRVTPADLPPEIDQDCIYMTSEDESDDETSNSTSPDDTPIMMTRRMDRKGPTPFELPIRRNTGGATSKAGVFSVATDSANSGISASGSNGMPPTAIITI